MPQRMPEAEVSLRLAFWLIETKRVNSDVRVAIDGAQVATGEIIHFPLIDFMTSTGWKCAGPPTRWQGIYRCGSYDTGIEIHSRPGVGDVVAELRDGRVLRVECKKGPLTLVSGSPEYPLLRSVLGHLLTLDEVNESDIIAVAVPKSARFPELAARWRAAPLVRRCGIHILLVGRDNQVEGLDGAG